MLKLRLGDIEVYPIQDVEARMAAELFSGPLSAGQRAALMPGGAAPASGNIFLVRTKGLNVLLDSGWGGDFGVADRGPETLRQLGVKPADVHLVLLTHVHQDHVMGLLNKPEGAEGAGDSIGAAYPRARVLLSRVESEFLLASEHLPGALPGSPEDERFRRAAERMRMLLSAYGERLGTFEFGDRPAPGILALDASGHTRGHTAYMIESGGEKLLVAGDFIHAAALQFPNPDEYPVYDMDPPAAVKTRKALCDLVVGENIPLAGMHLPYPGVGRVRKNDAGGYIFEMLQF